MLNIIKKDILAKIEKYKDRFENLSFDEFAKMCYANQKIIASNTLCANNVENIETGISGYLFFLLEVYKYTNDKKLLSKINSISKEALIYCENNPTSNFSLYTGRGGFVYFLLQLYKENNDVELLNGCVELLKSCDGEYLESPYTSDYLYNGRSGTLLILADLYLQTKSDEVLFLINRFSEVIIKNSILTSDGISWKTDEEINLKNSCGFAFGSSGILYTFKKINLIFPTKALQYIIDSSQKYIDNCWNKDEKKWTNYEKEVINKDSFNFYKISYENNDKSIFHPSYALCWSSGQAGIEIAVGNCNFDDHLSMSELNDLTNTVFNGISGIGLSLLNYSNRDSNLLDEISNYLLNQIDSATIEGGLLFGDLGIYYFLLKLISDNGTLSLIKPCTYITGKTQVSLQLDRDDISKALLKRYYNRTITFLDNITPNIFQRFCNSLKLKNEYCDVTDFENFIAEELLNGKETAAFSLLEDVFYVENQRKCYLESDNRTTLQIYLDNFLNKNKVLKFLNKSDQWIFEQQISISSSVKIVRSKWNWDYRENFSFVENFYNSPSSHEYLFLSSKDQRIVEFSLKIDGLIIHCFDTTKNIKQALAEIKFFCESQPSSKIEEFTANTGSTSVEDFINRLDFLVFHKIKSLLYLGILKIEI